MNAPLAVVSSARVAGAGTAAAGGRSISVVRTRGSTDRTVDAALAEFEAAWRHPSAPASTADLVIDLAGGYVARPGQEVWRLETGDRRPLFRAFMLSADWQRSPHALRIELVHPAKEACLGMAWIGVEGSYESLAIKAARTAALLVRKAVQQPAAAARPATQPRRKEGRLALALGWVRRQRTVWRSRLFVEWWTVGVVDQPIEHVLRQGRLGAIAWLRPGRGQAYWADPFAWPDGERVLCEEMPVAGGQGIVVALRPARSGGWERELVVLAEAPHTSYPCTFREDGATYLLPEIVSNAATTLLQLGDDGALVPICHVAPQPLADPTLFRHGRRYWVAGTDLAVGAHDNLCLFHAEALRGPWRAHPRNPVKLDIRSSRSAGTPFHVAGSLYRPAQDCAASYGSAITINRVLILTEEDFTEEAVVRLEPGARDRMPDGLHTIAKFGTRTLVDGKRLVLAPRLALRRAGRRVLDNMVRRRREGA